jgi:KDO2-lipid IV(A) lauroyltransferase
MAKPRNNVLDYLVYIAARVAAMFVHMLPAAATYRAAEAVADAIYRLLPRIRQRATEHLRASYPHLSEQRIDQLARQSTRSLACLGLEVLLTARMITPWRWRRHIQLAGMTPVLRLLLENKTGVVFVTGHFGNFEVVGYTMATLGFPTVAVARPLDNPYINEWLLGVRERTGQSILYKKGATASMDDILEARGSLSFIADQDAGRKGAFVTFFGRPASTFKTPALMAMRHNAPIVVGYGRRLGSRQYRFEIGIERVITPDQWAGKDDPMMWITQEYTACLEQMVRRTPEQYLWVHRRWKHQPPADAAASTPAGH